MLYSRSGQLTMFNSDEKMINIQSVAVYKQVNEN